MPDEPYTLADLARLADVTPRTVRYYVSQGLLPSPEAAGPATRYGEAHLARLRLIRRLQRDHLPLAEIRLRLERMRDEEVLATVTALEARPPEPPSEPGDTLAFVRGLMTQAGIRPSGSAAAGLALRATAAGSIDEAWAARPASATAATARPSHAAPAPAAPLVADAIPPAAAPVEPDTTRVPPDRSTWERLVISPDVELHVRRPLDRHTNKRVDQLERIARELFEDD